MALNYDPPSNLIPRNPVKLQGNTIGLNFSSNKWLWTADTKLYLNNVNQWLSAFSATRVMLNGATEIAFNIGGGLQLLLSANTLLFDQGFGDVGFDWTETSELDVQIDSTSEYTFTANEFYPITTDVQDDGLATNRWDGVYSQFVNPSHATNPSTQVGNLWYNETTNTHRMEADDGIHNIVGAESLITADDVVSNKSTKTYFTTGTKDIAANSLVVGSCYEFWASGKLTTDATITYTWGFDLDSVVIVSSVALTQVADTTAGWVLHGFFTVRTVGITGTVQGNAFVIYPRGDAEEIDTPATATVDTTQTLTARCWVQMSVAGAGKTCTAQQIILKKVS